MKTYIKSTPPPELSRWLPNVHSWDEFALDATSYQPVKTALLTEQYHLCCYCESSLTHDSHIEHFHPRNGQQGDVSLTFDYENLGCSCNGSTGKNAHCGHCKSHKYDPALFVAPTINNIARLFVYTLTGSLRAAAGLPPHEEAQVGYMVEILNLDCPRLNNMRRSHAQALQDSIQGLIDANAENQIEDFALFYLTPTEGKLQPFFSLSRQFFGERAEAVLSLFE